MNRYKWLQYSGMAAFVFLLFSFFSGMSGMGFRFHMISGVLLIFFATLHVILALWPKLKKLKRRG